MSKTPKKLSNAQKGWLIIIAVIGGYWLFKWLIFQFFL